ncbi:MAG: hypothetical protein IKC09_01890, partial [Oscillospiraceae bacterium]|nr:hypothetical protein [Oscillospiraceae bacterium]
KRGLAKIGSSEPIFDWGSSFFSPRPFGPPPLINAGGKGCGADINYNLPQRRRRQAFLDNPLPKGYTGFILKKDG